MPRGQNNPWINKLRTFNQNGNVWAIPKKGTDERKLLDEGKNFKAHYTLGLVSTVAGKDMKEEKQEEKQKDIQQETKEDIQDEKDEFTQFALAYINEGKKITKENIWYVGNMTWFDLILLDILDKHKNIDAFYFTYVNNTKPYKSFEIDFVSTAKNREKEMSVGEFTKGNKEDCARTIYRAHQQNKILVMSPMGILRHANLLIYRPKENVLEHFEPHGELYGSPNQDEYISVATKNGLKKAEKRKELAERILRGFHITIQSKYGKNIYKLPNNTLTKEENEENNKYVGEVDDATAEVNKFIKQKALEYKEKRKSFQNKILENFLKSIWKQGKEDLKLDVNKFFKKTKIPSIRSTEVIHQQVKAIKGFQTLENLQYKSILTPTEYRKQVGGYCVMWSAFACELIAKQPEKPTAEIVAETTDKINALGEEAWIRLMLGYVKKYEKVFSDIFEKAGKSKFTFEAIAKLENIYEEEIERVKKEQAKKQPDPNKIIRDISKTVPYQNAYWEYKYFVSEKIEELIKKGRL